MNIPTLIDKSHHVMQGSYMVTNMDIPKLYVHDRSEHVSHMILRDLEPIEVIGPSRCSFPKQIHKFMTTIMNLFLVILFLSLSGCAYLGSTIKQTQYSVQQKASPKQSIYKHMLQTDNFFVFGKVENEVAMNKDAIAVVAFSKRNQHGEVVDVSHFTRIDSYFGLNLPAGEYNLLVVSDLNRDGFYDNMEIAGGRSLSININTVPEKVLGNYNIDLDLNSPFATDSRIVFHLAVYKSSPLVESLFYPKGTIRSLDDEIFTQKMAILGMYEPAAFTEEAPMMFYALEEDLMYKVPVIFVHGASGSARDFEEIVSKLDRTRYRPWFFYYPSGNNLSQLSELFYKIFLSGKVIPLYDGMPVIIVAHSMGGLIARDAMNRYTGAGGENKTRCLITIASPLAGDPTAVSADNAPIVIPSWHDIAPESDFMRHLRRRKLPDGLDYHLLYAYGNSDMVKFGENSDGVVPLSSQLVREAQDEATAQYGFNDTHTGILKDPEVVGYILKVVGAVKSVFPEDHMKEFLEGGYSIELGDEYSPAVKYTIRTTGHWLDALGKGTITPIHPAQTHFVQAYRGEEEPYNDFENELVRFFKQYPSERN